MRPQHASTLPPFVPFSQDHHQLQQQLLPLANAKNPVQSQLPRGNGVLALEHVSIIGGDQHQGNHQHAAIMNASTPAPPPNTPICLFEPNCTIQNCKLYHPKRLRNEQEAAWQQRLIEEGARIHEQQQYQQFLEWKERNFKDSQLKPHQYLQQQQLQLQQQYQSDQLRQQQQQQQQHQHHHLQQQQIQSSYYYHHQQQSLLLQARTEENATLLSQQVAALTAEKEAWNAHIQQQQEQFQQTHKQLVEFQQALYGQSAALQLERAALENDKAEYERKVAEFDREKEEWGRMRANAVNHFNEEQQQQQPQQHHDNDDYGYGEEDVTMTPFNDPLLYFDPIMQFNKPAVQVDNDDELGTQGTHFGGKIEELLNDLDITYGHCGNNNNKNNTSNVTEARGENQKPLPQELSLPPPPPLPQQQQPIKLSKKELKRQAKQEAMKKMMMEEPPSLSKSVINHNSSCGINREHGAPRQPSDDDDSNDDWFKWAGMGSPQLKTPAGATLLSTTSHNKTGQKF